ncbi:hypothetical protein JNB88_24475 [Rhizobium cauense]|uniref:LysR substrate-binding domain-containing protein n=1 Tax=Rhizobium cauense TaxID=1166683 RepID=UPI003B83A56C|nr:hypothetical protein [Rhizobium cauense]
MNLPVTRASPSAAEGPQQWRFKNADGNWISAQIRSRLRLDSGEALHSAVGRDLGIALMPNFLVGEEIQSGRFVHILPEIPTETVESAPSIPTAGFSMQGFDNSLTSWPQVCGFNDGILRHI